ncbi:DUF6932 family protein [Gordonia sp. (in: high G+C Gram-positive bacteria)]|uniref:DUF6932 family protein n=1 Tax=Gordonia sp. (in: high G+C Gram-positive bacteria) TaxID=84139 RepID=UPI001DEB76D4|nr:hypothetical protein [Gordonia sp. (in: high G+C Gram-positive bacteria)]MCB1297089.1 hypothetical protein [Gordonia sp. (in: high G+C Gram-positive bacteria)]HMS74145.1 hypothetical protein [Gordonia sp. (in: high G+C Gram-positive bacteria)]HQV17386.1 hypothetical protein [Gordonia sp. (in: high G+C Gram-positive bacteria)]
MTILTVDDDGYLPATPLPTVVQLADVYDSFVDGAPNRQARDRIYRALAMHLDMLTAEFGPARTWIGGDFISRSMTPPEHVEVVYICRTVADFLRNLKKARFDRVLSLRSVIVGHPRLIGVEDLHPVSGLVHTDQIRPEKLPFEYERLGHIPNLGRAVGFVEVHL